MRRADAACALTSWQHFSGGYHLERIIIRNPTPSIDAYLREEYNPAKFHPEPI